MLPLTRTAFRCLILGSCLCAAAWAAEPLKVLYFTKSAGWEHSVVKRGEHGEPSHSERLLTALGAAHDIDFTFSKDGSLFSPEYLAQFDVVFFYTSGNLEMVGTDGNPPMSPAGKRALLGWVAGGGGFMAVHAGSDSFHTYERYDGNTPQDQRGYRYQNNGEASDPYVKMLGGEFINHGPQQEATAHIIDRTFPGFESLEAELTVHEEWYSLKEFSPINRVLMVLDTEGMKGSDYDRPDYPVAWAKPYGQGRVYYNAMGHREDVWDADYYQQMLVGALRWLGRRVDADLTPNLLEVAPESSVLPPPRS
ncbi:ThuA domain-containing protein [Actomonas aquatica]|uniref:ThuA domain-containing protein n=1 Tax=Actomonas aquatica TaxID=2866162 RepID=A0ABZ1C844_9BACT|nr:ThuA domain-containing protein [Opitutus sp. WL0086]WRQ87805.1 ThuA domain-containing protein [Opitutus sp. WL0086]